SSATDLWQNRTPSSSDDAPAPTDPSFAELWLDRDHAAAAPSGPQAAATAPDQRWSPEAVEAQPDAADLWRDSTPGVGPTTRTEPAAAQRSDPHAGWSGSTPITPFAPADAPSTSQSWATAPAPAPSWLDQPAPAPAQQPADTSLFTSEVPADFRPANDVEESLLTAAGDGNTDTFLSTLLLARVLLPVSSDSSAGAKPGGDGFVWRTETIDNQPYVVVFTSPERMAEHFDKGHETVTVKFVRLISSWPQEDWSFAVNPGTPVGAKLPGAQIVALASWAAEVGLDAGDDEPVVAAAPKQEAPKPAPAPAAVDASLPTMMQKTIAPSQVDYYLERGYDRVSGFVHRVAEVAHLSSPAQLFTALGLGYANSPFAAGADEVYVLRWPAYRPSLYRIPYGGPNETAMRAMEGWVIERAPFRGNGFAPGEGSEVIAEFKVDSARLPHGAQLWLIRADGSEKVLAVLDADAPGWTRVGDR
ncbi:MAG TPA: SseB family protein, partial [Asanoa sp.]|nr:SseB family protein [Asanoa sp.]